MDETRLVSRLADLSGCFPPLKAPRLRHSISLAVYLPEALLNGQA